MHERTSENFSDLPLVTGARGMRPRNLGSATVQAGDTSHFQRFTPLPRRKLVRVHIWSALGLNQVVVFRSHGEMCALTSRNGNSWSPSCAFLRSLVGSEEACTTCRIRARALAECVINPAI
eukprot:6270999-Amphidinium_carterae.1